jgi:hypothetical protein
VPGLESLEDVEKAVQETLEAGSVACMDGGAALKSAVKRTADGKVPMAIAKHGFNKGGKRQFTTLQKIDKAGQGQTSDTFCVACAMLSQGPSSNIA